VATNKTGAKTRRTKAQRFYEEALSQAEREELPAALEMQGVETEIALLIFRGLELLSRMAARRYRLSKGDSGDLAAKLAGLRKELEAMLPGEHAGV
jgi:hypothetical protein